MCYLEANQEISNLTCGTQNTAASHFTTKLLFQIFGALLRGCATNLVHLNVSHNVFNTKKSKELPPSFKQFFTSSIALKFINMSYCKLPLDALK